MADERLKVGDPVTLAHGGQPMTIINMDDHNNVLCTWIDGAGKPAHGAYPEAALRRMEKPKLRVQ